MKLISPIDHLDEAEGLLAAGANELYGGYVPAEWQKRFGRLASINQRTFAQAQIENHSELQQIVSLCNSEAAAFALTLNSPFYSDEQLPMLIDYVAEVHAAGVKNIILADLGLLRILQRHFSHLQFHASTLAHLGNSSAIKFYADLGFERVILPRHLSVAEIKQVVSELPAVDCDAFLLVGKCPNTEGYCTFHHSSNDRIWPCEIPYEICSDDSQTPVPQTVIARQRSWSETDRRQGCGLCAIPGLLDAGIKGLKLVGRGAPKLRKIMNVQLAREFLELAQQNQPFTVYRKNAMAAHRRHFGIGCNENVCYYPEFYDNA